MHSTGQNNGNDSIKIGTFRICSDMQSNVHKILAEGDNCVEMEGVARTQIISRIKFILLTLSLYFGISYHYTFRAACVEYVSNNFCLLVHSEIKRGLFK